MTKAELKKLHSVLTRLNRKADSLRREVKELRTEVAGIKASQTIMGNMVNVLDVDVRNLFHVTQETQNQLNQRTGNVVHLADAKRPTRRYNRRPTE